MNQSAVLRPLALRARKDLQCRPIEFRGHCFWTIKDPLSLKYCQLGEEEYFVLQLLDGTRTLGEVKASFEKRFAPRRLHLEELQAFLGTLHREGLVVADAFGQGEPLRTRRAALRRRRWLESVTNILAIRFRGLDPRPLLAWLYPKCRWCFSSWFLAGCLGLAGFALLWVAVHFESLLSRLPELSSFLSVTNVMWLAVALAVTKVLHELAHALTCKHYGGECHEMGLMLLVFTPCLYSNVSDAWMMPLKWHRIAVSAAGVILEIVLASICVFLWWFSEPGLFNALCLNMVIVCSISTLMVNGNPLLRYDGYYILADLVDIPNLQQQAADALRRLATGWLFGIDSSDDVDPREARHVFLIVYGAASICYRLFLIGCILWLLHAALEPQGLGVLAHVMIAMVVFGVAAVPVVRTGQFLQDPRRRRRINTKRALFTWALLAATLVLVGSIPFPHGLVTPLILQPRGASSVYVTVPGTLIECVEPGDTVDEGETLAVLENLSLELEIAKLRSRRDQQRRHVENLVRQQISDPAAGDQLPTARQALEDIERRLQQRMRDQRKLTVSSPAAGTVLPPFARPQHLESDQLADWSGTPLDPVNRGALLDTGTIVCHVGDPRQLEAILVVDQADIELVRAGQQVRLLLDELPGRVIGGKITQIATMDLEIAPPELVAARRLPVERKNEAAPRPLSTSYQARVELEGQPPLLLIGGSGQARIVAEPQSLARRFYRFLRRTFG